MEKSIKEIKVLSNAQWEKIKKDLIKEGYLWVGGIAINDYPILEKTDFPFYINLWKKKKVTWCYAGLVEGMRSGNIIEVNSVEEMNRIAGIK